MADLGTLLISGASTNGTTDWDGTTTYTNIDEGITGADGSVISDNSNANADVYASYLLGNVPSDLSSLDTIDVNVRYRVIGAQTNNRSLYVQLVKETDGTALTTERTIETNITSTTMGNSGALSMTISGTPSKADLDDARVVFRLNVAKSKGGDTNGIEVDTVEFTGTYTGGTNATVDLTTDGAVDAVAAVARPGVDIVELPATVNATGDLPGAALDITITSLLPNIGTGAIPAPTVETGSPHTEEAVTVNGVADIPATVAVGITEDAATVTATVGFGTFTVSTDSELPSPATLNTIAGIPATVEVGITEDAVTVDAVAGFGTSTISTDSDLPSPTSITAPVAVGDETLSLTSDLPAPTTINTISSIGTETVTADSTLTPATLNTTTAIPAPTVDTTGTANPQPDTLNATTTIPQPAASITEDAATLNAIAAVPAPTVDVGGDAERTPATINNPAGIPATTPATDSNLPTPATVNVTTTIPAPTVDTTTPANPTPATLNASAALPAPTISGDTAPAPTSLPATGAVPSPTVDTGGGDATRTPDTITTTTSIPTTTNDLDYIFTVESIPAYVDTITATITAGSGDADFWLAFTSEPTHASGFSSTSDVTFTMQMERNEG